MTETLPIHVVSDTSQVTFKSVSGGPVSVSQITAVAAVSNVFRKFFTCATQDTVDVYDITGTGLTKCFTHKIDGITITHLAVYDNLATPFLIIAHLSGILCVNFMNRDEISRLVGDVCVCDLAADKTGQCVYFLRETSLYKWTLGGECLLIDENVKCFCSIDSGVCFVRGNDLIHFNLQADLLTQVSPETFLVRQVSNNFLISLSISSQLLIITVFDLENRRTISKSIDGVITGSPEEKVLLACSQHSHFVMIGTDRSIDVQLLRIESLEQIELLDLEDCHRFLTPVSISQSKFLTPLALELVSGVDSGPTVIGHYEGGLTEVLKLSFLTDCQYSPDHIFEHGEKVPAVSLSRIQALHGEHAGGEELKKSGDVKVTRDGVRLPFWEADVDQGDRTNPPPLFCIDEQADSFTDLLKQTNWKPKYTIYGIQGFGAPKSATTVDGPGSLSSLTLDYCESHVRMLYYGIQSADAHFGCSFPRSWVVEGKSEATGNHWVVIDKREHVTAFETNNQTVVFKVQRHVDACVVRIRGRNLAMKEFFPLGKIGPTSVKKAAPTPKPRAECTFAQHGRNRIAQNWYNCRTCGLVGNLGCCEACAEICHKDHDISFRGIEPASYCDCGAGSGRQPCQCCQRREPV